VPKNNISITDLSDRIRNIGTNNIRYIIYLLIFVLSVDTVINQLGKILGESLFSSQGIPLFIFLSGITIVCQLLVLQFVSNRSRLVRRKNKWINVMHKSVIISQYSVISIFIYLIIEIILKGSYSPILSLFVSTLSYLMGIVLMGIFALIFLSWYRNNFSSILVLIYGLSFVTVVIASVSLLSVWVHLFSDQIFIVVTPLSDMSFPLTEKGSIWKALGQVYQYSDIASFLLKWGGTAIILYHYSSKLGKIKYWVLLCLPLLYFSTLIIYHSHVLEGNAILESSIYLGIASLNSTFGGILFYLAFKLTAKNFESNKIFRDFLIMTGYGFMLFFSGTQASLVNTAYPPFGFATVSTYGLGSYLILLGLFLSAKSVSQNDELKKIIKESTLAESKFLHSIGTSAGERKQILLKSALLKSKIQNEKEIGDSGIIAPMSEEAIKEYVSEIDDSENK